MPSKRVRIPRLMLYVLVAALVTACGSPPAVDEPEPLSVSEPSAAEQPEGDAGVTGGHERMDEISAALEGLDGDARRQRLIELAMEEGGEINFYGTVNVDDVGPVFAAFEDATGISIAHYRASAESILQRVLQEDSAGIAGADVVQAGGTDMLILDGEGLLVPLDTPVREGIFEGGRFDTWLALDDLAYIPAWNTDYVSEDQRPTTWEEVLQFDGQLAMDDTDIEWFATLVNYFMDERGMTEEEAVGLFRDAARDAMIIRGHTTGSQMLVAGEYDLSAATFHHHHTRFPEDAPFGWEPAVEPIVVEPFGLGIVESTTRPASALLLLEFFLTDGQSLLAESGRTPASTLVEGGLPTEYETITFDLVSIADDREHWEALYEEVIRESGRQPVE